MIKARLESITFGKVVTKYYPLPEWIFKYEGIRLAEEVIEYLLDVSGYRFHTDEKFMYHIK